MANISGLNKLLKLQRLSASNLPYSCNYSSLASKFILEKQQKQELDQKIVKTSDCYVRLLTSSRRVLLSSLRALSTTSSTTTSSTSTTTIDEFREREEKREREYAEQLAAEERRTKQEKNNVENEAKNAKLSALRIKILESALTHVPNLGWSRAAIVRGAEEVGLPSVAHGMFPEGGFALVSYFYGKCNEQLVEKLRQETQNGQKQVQDPGEFVQRAIRARLEMVLPYKSQWAQAIALMAAPQNASTALAQVLTLVDDICYYSGDRSVDMRWYARRIGVATLMKMTELFMLQDNSPDHCKTWEFLQSRLEEALRLQSLLDNTEGVTHNFQRSFNSAFETARNILGMGHHQR